MLPLLTMLSLALADGDPHNPVGVDIPRSQQDVLDTYDAAQVSRREVDTLLPLEWTFERVAREDFSGGDRWVFTGRLAGSQAYGIGLIDARCDTTNRNTNFECPRGQTTRAVPVDSMASTLTIGAHREKFSIVYVGSVNQLQIDPRNHMRPVYPQVYTTAYGALSPLLMFADLSGYPERVGFPRAAHLFTGAYRAGDWQVRLGTTLSLRPYFYLRNESSDIMGEVLLRRQFNGLQLARSARVGLDRHRWGNEDAGRTTLMARNIDLVDVRSLRNQTRLANLDKLQTVDLWWIEAVHDDILGSMDVHLQYALSPDPTLLEASVGVHTKSFYREPDKLGLRGFMGAVRVPKLPGYKAERERGPTIGVETHFPWGKPGFGGTLRVAYNDPQLVTRLPYSASALHFSFAVNTP